MEAVLAKVIKEARILVVDDEPANVRLLEFVLEDAGFSHVQATTDSSQVLSLFTKSRPDLLVLDLAMPRPNGFEVMQLLQPHIQEEGYFPILVLTADISPEAKLRALAQGAKDFLTKPFDGAEAVLRIENLLEARLRHVILGNAVRERTCELEQSQRETLERLALAAEYRDDDTGLHAKRVGQTTACIAEALGMPSDWVRLLGQTAPLHDVGKIGISDTILLKPGKLTVEEFTTMKEHAVIGAGILSGSSSPWLKMAAEIALSHHERWDGAGYPHGIQGQAIPLTGRLLAVADVFDALTHERPYKKDWPVKDAVEEVRRLSGHHFDPKIVEAFLTLSHETLI
jgi:putative two-component system response regulator